MKRNSNKPESNGVKRYEINNQHWYRVPNPETGKEEWLPSVTRFTGHYPKGHFFEQWLSNQGGYQNAQRIKEEAGDRGNNVHAGIEALLTGEEIRYADFTKEEWKHLLGFKNWAEDFRPQVLGIEEIVYSLRSRVAGTLDLRCIIGGKHCVVDHKTSSAIYRAHEIQSNEYGHLSRELGNKVDVAAVLRTGSKHKRGYEFKQWTLCQKMHELFEALLKVGKDFDPSTEPRIEQFPNTLCLDGEKRGV